MEIKTLVSHNVLEFLDKEFIIQKHLINSKHLLSGSGAQNELFHNIGIIKSMQN